MKKIYVIVRKRAEASDFQVVDVLQSNRAFTVKRKAETWAKELKKDFGGKYKVVPLTPE